MKDAPKNPNEFEAYAYTRYRARTILFGRDPSEIMVAGHSSLYSSELEAMKAIDAEHDEAAQ